MDVALDSLWGWGLDLISEVLPSLSGFDSSALSWGCQSPALTVKLHQRRESSPWLQLPGNPVSPQILVRQQPWWGSVLLRKGSPGSELGLAWPRSPVPRLCSGHLLLSPACCSLLCPFTADFGTSCIAPELALSSHGVCPPPSTAEPHPSSLE